MRRRACALSSRSASHILNDRCHRRGRLWTLTKYPGHRERGQNACRGRFIVPTADLSAPGKPYSMSVVICQCALSCPPPIYRPTEYDVLVGPRFIVGTLPGGAFTGRSFEHGDNGDNGDKCPQRRQWRQVSFYKGPLSGGQDTHPPDGMPCLGGWTQSGDCVPPAELAERLSIPSRPRGRRDPIYRVRGVA